MNCFPFLLADFCMKICDVISFFVYFQPVIIVLLLCRSGENVIVLNCSSGCSFCFVLCAITTSVSVVRRLEEHFSVILLCFSFSLSSPLVYEVDIFL